MGEGYGEKFTSHFITFMLDRRQSAMKATGSLGLRISILAYAIFHFITYFYENTYLVWILSLSGLGVILFSTLKLNLKNIKIPIGLFTAGIVILLFWNVNLTEGVGNGLLQMRNVVGLLIIVPMIQFVLKEENYIESIISFVHSLLDTSRKFYFGLMAFIQVIAYFLLLGAIPMMYHVVNSILKNKQGEAWEHYKSTALIRGYSLSVIWVISIPSFAYAVEIMGAPLGITIIQGLGISFVGIIIALVFSYFEEKKYGVDLTAGLQSEIDHVLEHQTDQKQIKRLVIEFIILFITLVSSIFIFYAFLDLELLVLIPLIVLIWITVYYLIKRRPKRLTQEVYAYFSKDVEGQGYQLSMMLGVGVFIYALNQTGFAQLVVGGIYTIQETVPFFNILYFLPLIIIILGFFGLGPMTVMVLVGGILGSIQLPYPPELIVLAITSGSAISILLSPLIMPLIIMSSENGMSALKNGIRFNWKYAIAIYGVVQVYIQLIALP